MANPDTRPLAVVTGASSGIGYEPASLFSEAGYDLVVAAEDPGITTAATIFSQQGIIAEAAQADLATYDGVEELYAALRGRVPAAVAREGFDAMMAGENQVVAGSRRNKLLAIIPPGPLPPATPA